MPSPVDIPPVSGTDEAEAPVVRKADDEEKFSALAFKLMTDPFVGQLTFVRVYSGVLKKGDSVYNPVKGKKERIGRIVQMHANNREEVSEIRAGDIAACVGLKDVTTGETLCDPDAIVMTSTSPKNTASDKGDVGNVPARSILRFTSAPLA